MTVARQLIVNADDFGQSPGVNRGIIEAYERGIVTSASLMVRWPNAPEAAAYSRVRPDLSLGLHLDLGEWAFCNETWIPLYEVAAVDDVIAVADEVSRQLTAFRRLVGKYPTHIDSHQHVHLREPVRSVAIGTARKLAVPLRHCSPEVNYCGAFYGQTDEGLSLPGRISADGLIRIIAALPSGLTELSCHPSVANDLDTMYGSERIEELKVLSDPQVRAAVADMGIELRSFIDPGTPT